MTITLPRPSFALVVLTHIALGVLFLVGLGAILVLPGISASMARSVSEYAALRVPLLTMAIAFTVVGLIAIGIIAVLIHRIYTGAVLDRSSLRWVDGIVASLAVAVALVIAAVVTINYGQAGSPFLALVFLTVCVILISLACITLVLRSLLSNSILLRAELDEVV